MSIVLINADGTYTIPVSQAAITGVTALPAATPTQYVIVNADGSYTIPEVNSTAVEGSVKTIGRPVSEFTTKGAVTHVGTVNTVAGVSCLKTAQQVGNTSTVAGISAPYSTKNFKSTLFTGAVGGVAGVTSSVASGKFVDVAGVTAVAGIAAELPVVTPGVGAGTADASFLDESVIIGGVAATGGADISFGFYVYTATTPATGLGTAYAEFIASSIQAFEGNTTASATLMELTASGTGFGGAGCSGVGDFEFSAYSAVVNIGAFATSQALICISADGYGYSNVILTPDNEAVLDVLSLPVVAFSMNVKTKGVSAYTANVNNTIPPLVSTPVSNMGSKKKKRVSDLYVHMRSAGDVGVSTITDETKSRTLTTTIPYDDADGVHTRRAKLSRNTEGVNWQFFLESDAATSFDVEFIEVVPRISESRTR